MAKIEYSTVRIANFAIAHPHNLLSRDQDKALISRSIQSALRFFGISGKALLYYVVVGEGKVLFLALVLNTEQ